ncbi:bifunctional GTP diphosphokinase/guanosine-3',5'-bis(diphosphate) 3'-diphosphatase [Alkalilimnicola ehrlichii]|uniref:guanosine-3',5'-bis(diphosphate) 3'-diphosphatase n=1 Tax=Alkalilimnicola ehrlichii TaxID=351052 RepID=A0A3E0X490_9GAMM|nr:bifunctional GTP diphosphokinase/guanosine-3',5'-bis pyrophosphate 3'-pyrophosphohydrolase [Alkalilimnicola ehrlichii]RFA31171.1 bifunctional GTP diphosphokinase/guanosine-3',5'-bis(diphosphate) 3'-diphosphatase [Alkalilimnicola ehrlichii]RFA39544.1 bifunctional GTP diphosphokinase/guanosine-3',5'-bis(diphosphate) 3'-diphosphatase [Alkalilimnicola ehrlichii]
MGRSDPLVPEEVGSDDPARKASDLCSLLDHYLEPKQVRLVYEAYRFGAEAHAGQRRLSGEPYITHPLAVAKILAEMRLDYQSIVAAILHDVIEDTPTAKDHVASAFGEDVAELVDGVSKLTQIDFKSKAEAQAENFRKMVLAMSRDIRVILIKLADRLHNMRTIWVMPPHKRHRIARETLEIYAPIAQRLGINTLRIELEDLGFAALYPMRYRVLKEKMRRQRGHRSEIIDQVTDTISIRLGEAGIDARVVGREKHLWSIYQKMRDKNHNFKDIFDVYGFRIIVDNVDTCYRVLGVLHSLYKPKPGRIKDYIAIPKVNGYQSLHTSLVGPRRMRIEAQVRTEEMHRVAEAGIAAHWLYKESDTASNTAQARAREWVKGLLEMQRNAGNSLEFIENVKIDLQPDEIYVFTPKGGILELPRGATVIDFAYAVHSDIGDGCIAAMIDHRLAPLRTPLQTGQTVEIITAPGARPNPAWLDFVVTAKARTAIRHSLKRLRGEAAAALGQRLVDQALASLSQSLSDLSQSQVDNALDAFGVESLEALFETVGLGQQMPWLVAQRLSGIAPEAVREGVQPGSQRLYIKGTEGAVVTFARCCRPIPGDPVVGFASAGRGVVIHHRDCRNVKEYRNHPEKWVDVQWEPAVEGDFPVLVAIDVVNRRGVLAELAANISEMESNIESVAVDEKDGMVTTIRFVLSVRDRVHLAHVLRRLRLLSSVTRITRRKG